MRTRPIRWTPAQPTAPDPDLPHRIDELAQLLNGRRVLALTGAGMSTDSGIPDYRSPGTPPRTPMTIEMFLSSSDFRRHYWARNHLGWRHMDAAVPNAGHRALAALERRGRVSGVITQNVDMLHLKAGNRAVLELHGSYGRVRCLDCDHRVSRHRLAELLEPANAEFVTRIRGRGAIEVAPDADVVVEDTTDFAMLDCPDCGGILKPDIVYFGESVPKSVVQQGYSMVDEADAVLVLGSSLTVMSGLRFVRHARRTGKPIAIVNRGHTRGDECATMKIDGSCSEVLTGWLESDRDEIVGMNNRPS
ncbi:Sir2 family NAD-dependent protein deacetylase [Williamsia sp. DF01-3]|uniref:Sir2 family NAD-dependent protein deacetylase n=1 Tax=Williamsia sp. DF01-3 TaxID=2934157 RepID=UPI001FF64DA4|nr:Sir2 family NAD-dependent protein deacetylase [Williamsia sp. DF01-3]MCK0518394.1 NAD-dependent deacetylase [Williamsia sp. DF01-3]